MYFDSRGNRNNNSLMNYDRRGNRSMRQPAFPRKKVLKLTIIDVNTIVHNFNSILEDRFININNRQLINRLLLRQVVHLFGL